MTLAAFLFKCLLKKYFAIAPPLWREITAVLGKIGYEIDHQTGSHIIVRHIKPPHRRITIPNHKVGRI
jgi:hypothetical protein